MKIEESEIPSETVPAVDTIAIEYEFWDIKKALGESAKPNKQTEEWTTWLQSSIIYVN